MMMNKARLKVDEAAQLFTTYILPQKGDGPLENLFVRSKTPYKHRRTLEAALGAFAKLVRAIY